MDASPLKPKLVIFNDRAPASQHMARLWPSKLAKDYKSSGRTVDWPPKGNPESLLWAEGTAIEAAKAKARAVVDGREPAEEEYLGQLVIPYGCYRGKTFQWLLGNDVGYVKL